MHSCSYSHDWTTGLTYYNNTSPPSSYVFPFMYFECTLLWQIYGHKAYVELLAVVCVSSLWLGIFNRMLSILVGTAGLTLNHVRSTLKHSKLCRPVYVLTPTLKSPKLDFRLSPRRRLDYSFLDCCAAYSVKSLPTFRDNVSVSSSGGQ